MQRRPGEELTLPRQNSENPDDVIVVFGEEAAQKGLRRLVDDLRRSGEPLLADVFAVIERHHSEALSLRDVARELAMTPGHLTTIVRRLDQLQCCSVA